MLLDVFQLFFYYISIPIYVCIIGLRTKKYVVTLFIFFFHFLWIVRRAKTVYYNLCFAINYINNFTVNPMLNYYTSILHNKSSFES